MRATIPALALASAMFLSACGIKGPLYMPERPQQAGTSSQAAEHHSKPDSSRSATPTSVSPGNIR
ncbi:LPS translocon maturation chaperone LptM [Parazoarcus communis]|nr:lipoprotein [Parazoarcus communis]